MRSILIKSATLVNEGSVQIVDVLLRNERIEKIAPQISAPSDLEIDAEGLLLIPGIIDDQVHFREPGLTHKATIASESRAAVAGGVTSFMEMPNVQPPSVTQALLEEKYRIGEHTSAANFSFYMGTTNDNLDEVLRTDPGRVCGIKIFMGSSTGNMLVDAPDTLERIFSESPMLIATHCEDEKRIRERTEAYKSRFGDALTADRHPEIRDEAACLLSSSFAVALAKKHGTRLHVLHISTEEELALFSSALPLADKLITAEVCVHHLFFSADDYAEKGNLIKCNPAIKAARHKEALLKALLDDRLDVVATDHAPHTREEKSQPYIQAPSGLPLVQHSLNLMLDFYHRGQISLERIVEKMCHAPAIAFRVAERGFIREGYYADLVLVDPNEKWTVNTGNILYHCGWSPLEGRTFQGKVKTTFVNGRPVWHNNRIDENERGKRLTFER